MTRKSNLFPVPDAAESPVPADQPQAATAVNELRTLRQALHDARRSALDLEAVVARVKAVERRAGDAEADWQRIERDVSARLQRWIMTGGGEPTLGEAERQALEAARAAADRAAMDARSVLETLPALQRRRDNLRLLIGEAESAIKTCAIRLLAERHLERELCAAVNAERAALAARARAETTIEFFRRAGYVSGRAELAADRLGEPVSIVRSWVETAHSRLRDARITKADPAISLQQTNALHEELEALITGEFT